MRRVRGKRLFWGLGVLVATGWACETARNPGGIQRDLIPPTMVLTTSADTQQIASGLSFSVSAGDNLGRSEEHTSELQSQSNLVCRLLLEKKKKRQCKTCGSRSTST